MITGPVNAANNLVGVMRDSASSTLWCAAKEAWHYGPSLTPRSDRQCWVTAYPLAGGLGAGQYDGAQRSPHIEIVVLLRRGSLLKDPNIVAGNVLAYRATSALYPAIAGGGAGTNPCFEPADLTYLDEPVGTIRACAIAMAAPQGWAAMDGTSNVSGGSGIDAAQNSSAPARRAPPGDPPRTCTVSNARTPTIPVPTAVSPPSPPGWARQVPCPRTSRSAAGSSGSTTGRVSVCQEMHLGLEVAHAALICQYVLSNFQLQYRMRSLPSLWLRHSSF